ncbi:MAG TPA: HAD family hydrolase [Desulfosporosinus sp.]|jgi:phosphoglycolate phosphatase|nr:HAD family hydrolase [Desulfosporosinus sp.]
MKFKGIIFDLDGTLVNSLEDIADSMNKVLERYSFPAHKLQAYKHFVGNGIKNLVREALPESSKEEIFVLKCYGLMMEEYRNNCLNKTRPYDGIVELLNSLTTFKMKLAVLSNKDHELAKIVVTSLLPNCNFEEVIGVSAETPRKPNPLGALLISQQLGIAPECLIYVGDSDVDMQTANSAGMYAVGALWGFRTQEELMASGAKYLIKHPLELNQLLREDIAMY